jgi:hypothetical protein
VVDQVCQIVEHRINGTSSGDVNHKIVSDAMTLADLLEKQALLEKPAIEKLIDSKIQTPTGKRVAREQLLIEVES